MKYIRLLSVFLLLSGLCFSQTKVELFETGKDHLQGGRLITAVDYFSNAIRLDTNFAEAYYYRGLTYIKGAKSDCYEPAVKDFYKCISLQPDGNYWQAYFYIANQKLFPDTAALKYYDRAIDINPSNYLLYQKRGFLKHWNRMLSSAYQDYMKAVALNSLDVQSYDYMANIDMENGHYFSAITQINKGLEVDPDNAKLYFTKTEVLCRQNRVEEARKTYEMAMKKAEKSEVYTKCSCCDK